MGLATGDNFSKIGFNAIGSVLVTAGATLGLGALGIATLPATIAGVVIGGVIMSVYGDTIYDNVANHPYTQEVKQRIYDAGSHIGDAVGGAVQNFLNHDWQGEYDKGKASFENFVNQTLPDFWNDVKSELSDFADSADSFLNEIWNNIQNIFNDVGQWSSDTFGDIYDSVSDFFGDTFDKFTFDTDSQPVDPFVLDLNGDGVRLLNGADSPAVFDIDDDGFKESVNWANADDGFLVWNKKA